MSKILATSIRIGRTHSSGSNDFVSIYLEDELSGICFADIKLSLEEFGSVLTGMSGIKCLTTVRGLDNIGKKHQRVTASVVISQDEYNALFNEGGYSGREKALVAWLNANHPREGWNIHAYLGSRESIRSVKDGMQINYSYYRFVALEELDEVEV